MPPVRFACTTEKKNQILIVHFKGYFDEEGGAGFKQQMATTSLDGLKGVVLDFSDCLHANSSGISFLVDVVINLGDESRLDSAFCGLSPLLSEAFRMVGLTRLSRVFSTLAEAIRGLEE